MESQKPSILEMFTLYDLLIIKAFTLVQSKNRTANIDDVIQKTLELAENYDLRASPIKIREKINDMILGYRVFKWTRKPTRIKILISEEDLSVLDHYISQKK